MTSRAPDPQRGLTLIGLLISGIVIVFVVMITMRIFPTVTEYLAVKRAIVKARDAGPEPQAIRSAFDRYAAIDDITSITGKDLDIHRTEGGPVVSFKYEKKLSLVGPASLLLEYEGNTSKPK